MLRKVFIWNIFCVVNKQLRFMHVMDVKCAEATFCLNALLEDCG